MVVELHVNVSNEMLEVQAGKTILIFTQAASDFDGAYHFAFNIPENQFGVAKEWISSRISLLHDETGKEDFESANWNSHSIYFKDTAGKALLFLLPPKFQKYRICVVCNSQDFKHSEDRVL